VAPLVLWADSRAGQTSSIEDDAISIAFNLQVRTGAFAFGPQGPIEASDASSLFELTFQTFEPVVYELSGTLQRFWHDLPPPTFVYTLSNPLGTIMEGANMLTRTGTLLPDTYTFRIETSMYAVHDPLGDNKGVNSSTIMRFASVPEGGESWLLLGIGILTIAAGRKAIPAFNG
jgi:hypothetical protein